MERVVLHLQDYDKLDRFMLTNAFLGRGQALEIHISLEGGGTEIIHYTRDWTNGGSTLVRTFINSAKYGCGCP